MFTKSIEGHSHLGKTDNSTSSLKVSLKLMMSAHPRIRICITRTDTSQEKLGLDPKARKFFVLLIFGFCFLMVPGMLGSVPYTTEVKALEIGSNLSKQWPVPSILKFSHKCLQRHCAGKRLHLFSLPLVKVSAGERAAVESTSVAR